MYRFTLTLFFIALFNLSPASAQNRIVVSKENFRLYVINKTDTLFSAPIGIGINVGNKTRRGDKKTPHGKFAIKEIYDSSSWTHDFKDGAGERKGAYGPYFFRLNVPNFTMIGIHGTCFPETVGTRCSDGCVRLRNEDMAKLKQYAYVGMACIIEPDKPTTSTSNKTTRR